MRPSVQPTPSPTRRGCRTHQKTSTNPTKSGTTRRSRHGRKLSKSAIANDAMMVLRRTGCRIWRLPDRSIFVSGPAASQFFLAGLCLLGTRRLYCFVGQNEHEAPAVDAGGRAAHDTREGVLG